MTTLADALAGVTRIGLDTALIIYLIEEHPVYLALVVELRARYTIRLPEVVVGSSPRFICLSMRLVIR